MGNGRDSQVVGSLELFALHAGFDTSDLDHGVGVAALLDVAVVLLELGQFDLVGRAGDTAHEGGAGAGFLAAGEAADHGHEGNGENDFLHFHGVVFFMGL